MAAREEFLERGPKREGTSGGLSTQVLAQSGTGGRQAGREDQGMGTDAGHLKGKRAVKDRGESRSGQC